MLAWGWLEISLEASLRYSNVSRTMKYGLTHLVLSHSPIYSPFLTSSTIVLTTALTCLFKCYDVTITYQPHWQVWLWCVWSAFEKNCLAQNPQVNFVHFITVAPFIQVHIILNASISISSFCLFVWTCGVEVAVVKHGMKISTVVAMDADWKIIIIFFHLTKKTGLQVHPTTDMQVTESREEEKTEPSDTRRSSSVCFCYGLTSAGRKTLNVTWMELKSWQMDGWDD